MARLAADPFHRVEASSPTGAPGPPPVTWHRRQAAASCGSPATPVSLATCAARGVESTAYARACGLMCHRLSWSPILGPWWQAPQAYAPTYFGPGAAAAFGRGGRVPAGAAPLRDRVRQRLPRRLDVQRRPAVHGGVRTLDVVADSAVAPGEPPQPSPAGGLGVAHHALVHVLAARAVALLALHAVLDAEAGVPLPVLGVGGGRVAAQADRAPSRVVGQAQRRAITFASGVASVAHAFAWAESSQWLYWLPAALPSWHCAHALAPT